MGGTEDVYSGARDIPGRGRLRTVLMTPQPLIVTVVQSGNPELGGASMRDYLAVMGAIERAMRLMVEHLGGREPSRGQPPAWVQEQSQLQIIAQEPGSLVTEALPFPPVGTQLRLENHGEKAFAALRDWDGTDQSSLPTSVTEHLYDAADKLGDQAQFFIGDRDQPRRVCVLRRRAIVQAQGDAEHALVHGWLREVNWAQGTAQLHNRDGNHVRLRFEDDLGADMQRLATQYVEVRGTGRINEQDEWTSIQVAELHPTRGWTEQFELDELLKNQVRKLFDPDKVVTASEPFDADEFVRTIREARDA